MRNKAELNIDTLIGSSVLSFVQCILELVGNSLNAHAAAIAIRIHIEKREIHVIDNGIGIPKDKLEHITDSKTETMGSQYQMCELNKLSNTLTNIRQLSDTLTIASRYQDSTETFMKVFKMSYASNLTQIEQRPSRGTTISVYGFHETPVDKKWNISTICFLIATIAVKQLEVSFSIRDEERKKVVLRIARSHSPVEVLRTLFGKNLPLNHIWLIRCNAEYNMSYHGYIGLSDENTAQWIFLNHKLIYCPLILKLIEASFKRKLRLSINQETNRQDLRNKNIFILIFLTFSPKTFTFVTENEKRYVMFYDMQKILNNIKNSVFKCLTEQIKDRTAPYSCETQLVKQIYLKSERPILHNDINARNKSLTSLMKERKIKEREKVVTIAIKRKKITSASIVNNYFDKQYNKNCNIEAISCCAEKGKNMSNSIQHQTRSMSAERTELYEKEVTDNAYNNVDKMQTNFTNSVTNDSIGFHKSYDYNNDNNNDFVKSSPLSVWSNWTYYTNKGERNSSGNVNAFSKKNNVQKQKLFECTKQFDFLPRKLYNLLHLRHRAKLTNVQRLNSPTSAILLLHTYLVVKENWQHKQIPVHSCNLKQKLCEFRLSRTSLKYIKIINQVNNEFIAAWVMFNKMKILLMMDQHAVHERIRYENLLLRYKAQNGGELLSTNLREPLAIKLPTEACNLLLRNKILLKKYGVNLGSLKENTLLIRTVPQCLITNSNHCNNKKILSKIYGLLNDILTKRNTTNHANMIPLTVHNAIASEACHGIY
ncbi:DNA mismatch repair protein Mlh3 [Ooceraea biroi]|uniref:DNA mismatch repair protein Mlh3 n=1 Tax=Ooceraea biroi TaxID=2015173 RepID=UPI000F07674D|nr:DNA mismatch repair protein Mlh3 [Ooceraea biroi]